MSAKPVPLFSGRFNQFLDEFDTADPDLESVTKPLATDDERDLVGILIKENDVIWKQLLNNKFCQAMKVAAKDDKKFWTGFEWYSRQDYFYIANLIKFREYFVPKARTADELKTALDRIASAIKTTEGFFTMLITSRPDGLGINPSAVLGTEVSNVLKEYIKLDNSTAEKESYVISQVAMIACYQSYYLIAVDLHNDSTHKDTLWYKFWVEVNYAYGESCRKQRQFFIDNYEHWKDRMDDIRKLFKATCGGEQGLWDEAYNQIPR